MKIFPLPSCRSTSASLSSMTVRKDPLGQANVEAFTQTRHSSYTITPSSVQMLAVPAKVDATLILGRMVIRAIRLQVQFLAGSH